MDTPQGRTQMAVIGVGILLVGAVLWMTAWRPLTWLGAIAAVLGGVVVGWALLHPTRQGLPVVRSSPEEWPPDAADEASDAAWTSASQPSCNWNQVGVHASGPLIAVRFSGMYPSGSAGKGFATTMIQFLRNVLAESHAAGVILDVTDLQYTFGDAIGGLALPLRDGSHRFRPAAIVATGVTAESLRPLLGPNHLMGLAGLKLFGTTKEALEYIEQVLDRPAVSLLPLSTNPEQLLRQLELGHINSDHAPLACDIRHLGTGLTYNVMTRMRTEAGKANNGFGASETPAEYEARVRRIASELAQFASNGTVVLALQEAPRDEALLALLTGALPPDWRALSMPTRGETFSQVVLYSSSRLHAAEQPPAALGPQTGRVQLVRLQPKNGAAFTLANVHFKWGASCEEAMRALGALPGWLVVCGDFNRPPATVILPNALSFVPERPTSLKHGPRGPMPNAVDGFLLRAPAEMRPEGYWAYAFGSDLTLEELQRACNATGPWHWKMGDSAYGQYLVARPAPGVRLRLKAEQGCYNLTAEVAPESGVNRSEIEAPIRELLQRIGARQIRRADPLD